MAAEEHILNGARGERNRLTGETVVARLHTTFGAVRRRCRLHSLFDVLTETKETDI